MSRFMFKCLTVFVLALALTGVSTPALAEAPCVSFAGLQHCPLAGATLEIDQGQLVVTSAGGSGGVSIGLPATTSWHGESRIKLANGVGDVLTSSAISQGQVTSTTQAVRAANGVRLSATFTASSGVPVFTTLVYRDGQLVGGSNNNPSGSTAARIAGPIVIEPIPPPPTHWPSGWPSFLVRAGGACTWVYRIAQGDDHEIALANGQKLIGDEIRFTEQVDPPGAYPYLEFDRLVFEGNIQSSRFLSESVQ